MIHSSDNIDAVHSGNRLSAFIVLGHIFLLQGDIYRMACKNKILVLEFVSEVDKLVLFIKERDEHQLKIPKPNDAIVGGRVIKVRDEHS